MTLHSATENLKKLSVAGAIGLGGIIVLVVLVRVGILIKDIILPPKVAPPTVSYQKLPALDFPENASQLDFSYSLNTDTGDLPTDLPDRLNVFPIIHPEPNLLNLSNAKSKMQTIKMQTATGQLVPEVALGNGVYSWAETSGVRRKVTMDTTTFNFDMNSDYITYLPILSGQGLTQDQAIDSAQKFLDSIDLLPNDLDLAKTQTPDNPEKYVTYPQIFTVVGGKLQIADKAELAKIIRVDLYQKNVKYDLDTGRPGNNKMLSVEYPIVYPHPPHSTMSFWLGKNDGAYSVVQAQYFHQNINFPEDVSASYPLKTVKQAYDELNAGDGYIAAYLGTDTQIIIDTVYLAYYLGEKSQDYLMPIYIFEGENGFFGYVSAVSTDWIQ